jgi:N6-L-threonylcarbamoyladenine synthase
MLILAIETSCDETALALLQCTGGLKAPKFTVLKSLISSQIAIHRPFGGVVPNLAKREHLIHLPLLFQEILPAIDKKRLDMVAVTVGPGLEPALWTGIGFAKEIHKKHFPKADLVGVNHMEGHLYSFLLSEQKKLTTHNSQLTTSENTRKELGTGRKMDEKAKIYSISKLKAIFPAIGVVVSGGHTMLIKMESLIKWKKLGETRDDAIGEAFDKVARVLKLPYPGGPEIEKLAKTGNNKAIAFPRPMIGTPDYEFSFSGIKTSVLYYMRDNPEANVADVAASFQQAVVDVMVKKTEKAVRQFGARAILLSGGVAANTALRTALVAKADEMNAQFFAPSLAFNTDNAAMIGVAGYIAHLRNKNRRLSANANISL